MKALVLVMKCKKRFKHSMEGFELKVIDYSEAYTQKEKDEFGETKLVKYPETIEVKFENRSNYFYSLRVKDMRWIPEGHYLAGKGLSTYQVMKRMLKERNNFLKNRKE